MYLKCTFFFKEWSGHLDLTDRQWRAARLFCPISESHGTSSLLWASHRGLRGPGDLHIPWLGHLYPGDTFKCRLGSSFHVVLLRQGTWKNYILQNGQYCKILQFNHTSKDYSHKLTIETEAVEDLPELSYSPPSYNSFGLAPTQPDPFEDNTVEVMKVKWFASD